ncbi:flagellar biosynthetic protein FliQ, partial [Trinickia mobilis]|uniref:flagellar biosynthetic protein FliQ n=1 Tax=Trinickia mobilis TaxID=2816356 RepID=UPI001A8CF79D
MDPIFYLQQGLLLAALLSAPALAVATVLGVVVSLVLTVLQIQDQTLPFAVKLISISAVLLACGRWMGVEILQL